MSRFQILCVTMNQHDFGKVKTMNIHSDVIFANQSDCVKYSEECADGHIARMITTNTKGVGINRNICLMYADADFCLFADDDVTYYDDVESVIVSEFEANPKADIMVFHLESDDPVRKQIKYSRTRRVSYFERMPWGGVRIAFRLSSIKRANIWFTTLFGGGCLFPSGEDSMWLKDAKHKGLCIYVSDKTVGKVSFDSSTWFTGRNEKYYYGQGAFCKATHRYLWRLWIMYYALRTMNNSKLSFGNRIKWLNNGVYGYNHNISYDSYVNEMV